MNVYTAMMPRALWSVSRTTQHISCLIRGFAAAPSASCDVFDGALKSVQRDRASSMVNGMDAVADHRDPLADEVAARLVERLEDCTRPFPRALILGGSTLQVLRRLAGGVGGVETAVVVDTSPGMLAKVANEMSNGMGKRPSGMPHVEKLVLADPLEHEALPVDPSSFDVCISSLALHWVNDVPVSEFVSYPVYWITTTLSKEELDG